MSAPNDPDVNKPLPDAPSSHASTPAQEEAPEAPEDTTEPTPQETPGRSESGIKQLKDKVTSQKEKIRDKTHPPGGYDSTPLPDIPPGWTVKFVFRKATNLPVADIGTQASDPFIHATLTAAIPTRHKEDPPLTWRTRTMRKTVEPEWEEEWIVANVPASGFHLKCRLYDEDYPDHNDRLGNVTVEVHHVDQGFSLGEEGKWFDVKKRMGSKRAYLLKGISTHFAGGSMTPHLLLRIDVLGRSEGKGSQMYTVGPSIFFKHFSPMIGRLTGIKVNRDELEDGKEHSESNEAAEDRKTKKYDFQANELQLSGPVPEKLYHRFVEFRPIIGMMYTSKGLRGKILHKALRKQHDRIYNFNHTTEWGKFQPCTKEASLQFLRMAHFDEGGRIFTYVLTLDGLMRFTETGKEFGIDLLSKHTMHSDVATYIACSGEFFIRRLAHADAPQHQGDPEPDEPMHPVQEIPNGPPLSPPPPEPKFYQLVIDNDSGTYRPDKSVLPELQKFLSRNFPGLGITAMHWEDERLQEMKENQRKIKKKEGRTVNMVLNRSPSASSFSSSDESRLSDVEDGMDNEGVHHHKSKKEAAWDLVQDPSKIKSFRDLTLRKKAPSDGSQPGAA